MSHYYRNKKDLTSIEGIQVDAGSLWLRTTEKNVLMLEDEDQYATAYISEDFEASL